MMFRLLGEEYDSSSGNHVAMAIAERLALYALCSLVEMTADHEWIAPCQEFLHAELVGSMFHQELYTEAVGGGLPQPADKESWESLCHKPTARILFKADMPTINHGTYSVGKVSRYNVAVSVLAKYGPEATEQTFAYTVKKGRGVTGCPYLTEKKQGDT